MQKLVLLGTSHTFQKSSDKEQEFNELLKGIIASHSICCIAEEIDCLSPSIAFELANECGICHLIIEPTLEERNQIGIESLSDIIDELQITHSIQFWPSEPSIDNLPLDVFIEYSEKRDAIHRVREKEWLRRIYAQSIWPVLVICGANHFHPFKVTLQGSLIEVIDSHDRWGL